MEKDEESKALLRDLNEAVSKIMEAAPLEKPAWILIDLDSDTARRLIPAGRLAELKELADLAERDTGTRPNSIVWKLK